MSYPRRDTIENLPGPIHADPTVNRALGAGATVRVTSTTTATGTATATHGFGAAGPMWLVPAAGSNDPAEAS